MAAKWIVGVLSTDYDLHEHRTAVVNLLKDKGFSLSAFETADFPVEPNMHSHNACLVALERVDIAIIIIDKRAGGVYVDSTDITITEKEYLDIALSNKPHLVFVSKGAWEERHFYRTQLKSSGKTKTDFDAIYTCTYVSSTKVFDFIDEIQNAYNTRNTSNWITQFDGIDDLKAEISGKLSGLSRYICGRIVNKQKQQIERRHTSTSMMMTLGDVLDKGYYVEPDYTVQSGKLPDRATLDDRIVTSLLNELSVLIVGEAGYGKTTILAKSYLSHANTCLTGYSYNIPLYINLKSKGGDYHFDINEYLIECFADDLGKEKYPLFGYESMNLFFYLDGFDEIAEKLSSDELKQISKSSIMSTPFLLTCRNQYANRYIQNIAFADRISAKVVVLPWSTGKAHEYIHNFCNIRSRTDLIDDINGLLANNTELNETLDNPLLITMLLWIIESNGLKVPETIKSRVHLFGEYIEEMAKRELQRLDTEALSYEQLVRIWSLASWEVYYAKLKRTSITFPMLLDCLHRHLSDIPQLYNESWFEALFVSYREHINGTFHEQFMEYLSAHAIVYACACGSYPYPEFLSQVVRPEINRYFRALWDESIQTIKAGVIRNIKTEYTNNLLSDNSTSISKRVHSVYHLSRLKHSERDEFMSSALSKEGHLSVRLSLYFGAIKAGNFEKEEELFQLLLYNSEFSDANRGYHLTYYGDMVMGDKMPFKDDSSMNWNGTLEAFLRHFDTSDDGHYFLWRINLLTMQQLFEARQSCAPVDSTVIQTIEMAVQNSGKGQYLEFQNKVATAFESMVSTWKKYL
ncbi:MAG: NACHT domain-containing protein [Clostridiales bacterium]|jgi:hypothetical protein|nr:NACHT domain-containing protein [Clostridiales bacterium]